MPTQGAATTAPSPLDVTVGLDAAALFLEALHELPWFADKADGLRELICAVRHARTDWEERHGIDINDVEERSYARLRELGLFTESGHYFVEPGYGRDVALLDEKLRLLAEHVIGCTWSDAERAWIR